MSDEKTNKLNESRSFEERVFLRFDAMDVRFERIETRLDSLDCRVEKLEGKQYDTKPIWEQALAAISEVSVRLGETNNRLDETNNRLDETNTRIDARIDETNSRMEKGFEQLRSEMRAGFANQEEKTEHLVRDVFWQMEALNKSILKIQADQIYFHSRLRDVETQVKDSRA